MATKPNQAVSYKALPPYLRRMREEAKLTQRQLAARLKRPQWLVHRAESGSRRVDPMELIDWANACGVQPDEAIRQLAKLQR